MERANKTLLLAKIESTYKTDPTPSESSEAVVTKGMPSFEIVGDPRAREIPLPHFGKAAPVNFGDGLKISFTTELKGAGTPGDPPRFGPLLRACNMSEALSEGTDATYTPNSSLEGESVTIYFWSNGTRHKLVGCVGTFSISMEAGQIMTIDFEMTGLYSSDHASDITYPSPTYSNVSPIIFTNANFVYNSISSLKISSLSFDISNSVNPRSDANADTGIQRYYISDREPSGSMDPEKVALSTLNPWTIWDNTTQAEIIAKPDGSAGNIVELTITNATLEVPSYGDRENVKTWELSYKVNPTVSAGNNEVELVFK